VWHIEKDECCRDIHGAMLFIVFINTSDRVGDHSGTINHHDNWQSNSTGYRINYNLYEMTSTGPWHNALLYRSCIKSCLFCCIDNGLRSLSRSHQFLSLLCTQWPATVSSRCHHGITMVSPRYYHGIIALRVLLMLCHWVNTLISNVWTHDG